MTSADERSARAWLAGNGLPDAPASELLVARLSARRRARLTDQIVLAAAIIVAALAHSADLMAPAASSGPPVLLVVLALATAGLLTARLLIARWVSSVDRRAAAALPRRAALAAKPGWRVVLGGAHAAFGLATFAVAVALAIGALTVQETAVRQGAVVLLVALVGVAAGGAVQLRQLLAQPVVAEDEVSLTADVIMRIEDARECAAPAVLWSLPMIVPFGSAPAWWNAAAIAAVVLGAATLMLIHARTPASLTTARQAMIVG